MKVHFTSLGCPRNLADTERMMQILADKGHKMIASAGKADLIVLNTCGFLQSARDEGRKVLEDLIQEKKKDSFLIVTGCMIPLHKKEIEKNFEGKIDYFLSPKEEEKIGEVIALLEKKMKKRKILCPSEKRLFTTSHFAYIKIADGCQKQCSYCIIPKIRGRLKSRTHEEILEECKKVLSMGVFEIILVAQDLGDFGKDRGEKKGLVTLLKKILKIKDNFWLRLLYLYPDEIDDELLFVMKSDPRICPYFDLPIQHVNERILSLMKRKTKKQQIIDGIEKIRISLPNASLRTSLMVGFPSETEKEFEELCSFVRTYQLDQVGIFRYSKEKESLSASFPDQLSESVKKQREKILATYQLDIVRKKNQKKIGKTINALVEKLHPSSPYLAIARSQMHAPDVDGCILINDVEPIKQLGRVYSIEITDAIDYDLIGKVVVEKKGKGR